MTNQHPHLSARELTEIHNQMLAFAKSQLKDQALAEDAVQEALIKTITRADSFQGKSAYKSWVFSILKNSIIDLLRKNKNTINVSSIASDEDNEQALIDALYKENGHWEKHHKPAEWQTPSDTYENDEFWQVMEACLTNLPAEQSRIFMMREYVGLDTQEICDECNISSNKFYVIMHRARLKLQSCLSANWFDDQMNAGGNYA